MFCSFAMHAQTNLSGENGGGSNNANSYSNGNIPSPYEQNQNRPDSTLRSNDTTYKQQQWNGGSNIKQNKNTHKRSASKHKSTPHKGTTTNNKKK